MIQSLLTIHMFGQKFHGVDARRDNSRQGGLNSDFHKWEQAQFNQHAYTDARPGSPNGHQAKGNEAMGVRGIDMQDAQWSRLHGLIDSVPSRMTMVVTDLTQITISDVPFPRPSELRLCGRTSFKRLAKRWHPDKYLNFADLCCNFIWFRV